MMNMFKQSQFTLHPPPHLCLLQQFSAIQLADALQDALHLGVTEEDLSSWKMIGLCYDILCVRLCEIYVGSYIGKMSCVCIYMCVCVSYRYIVIYTYTHIYIYILNTYTRLECI